MAEARRIYGEREDFILREDSEQTLEGSAALAIVTEWREFRSPDFELTKRRLRDAVVFDGRNLYDPLAPRRHGLRYFAIGGDSVAPAPYEMISVKGVK